MWKPMMSMFENRYRTSRDEIRLVGRFRDLAFFYILLSVFCLSDAGARPDCDATPDIPACNGDNEGGNPPPAAIREGGLYREVSKPEVYVIQDGKKVWIPTPDALFAMGYKWSDIQVVPDGKLNAFPRLDIPSSSQTPGSLVFPPAPPKHFALASTPRAVKLFSQGKVIQLTEVRGWLWKSDTDDGGCNPDEKDGADFHFELELDTEWAISNGFNLHKILRVGNIAAIGSQQPGSTPRKAISIPFINVELNSWGWSNRYPAGANKPQDWTHKQANCKDVAWPFDPSQPDKTKARIMLEAGKRGPYVRMSGSLVTDGPHDGEDLFWTWVCRQFNMCDHPLDTSNPIEREWRSSVPDWAPRPGASSDEADHPARWTEMHPPDLIEVLDQRTPNFTVCGLALAARVAITPGPIFPSCEKQEFDIYPEAPRPPDSVVAYQELRGSYPEVHFPWGENADNGSWIQSRGDYIHVKAQVCGGALGGSPGRFKALYRVWWQPKPVDQPPRPCGAGKECCGDVINGECHGHCLPSHQTCIRDLVPSH